MNIQQSILDIAFVLQDLKFEYGNLPAGSKVVAGMNIGYESIKREVHSELPVLIVQYPSYEIRFVGHRYLLLE